MSQSPANPVQLGDSIEYTIRLTPDLSLNTDVIVTIVGSGLDVVSTGATALCNEFSFVFGAGVVSGWQCDYGDSILSSNSSIQSPVIMPPITITATALADEVGIRNVAATIEGRIFDCQEFCDFSSGTDTVTEIFQAQADLIIESLTHSPENPETNDVITFTAVVRNVGDGMAGPSTAALRVGGEGSNQATFPVPALSPGESFSLVREEQLGVAQNYRNTATADVNNQVDESDENNNITIDSYTVSPASLLPPVAVAGPDQTVRDSDNDESETITLDASGSSDPDATIVSYQWLENGSVIATGEVTSVDLSVGTHTITLRVTDSDELTDEDTLVVEVERPVAGMAVAGADQMVRDSDNDGSETVTLDGSGSSDPDGTIESYQWLENGVVIATGEVTSVDLSVGSHTIILRVTDSDGLTDEDTLVVEVESPVAGMAVAGVDQTVRDSDNDGSETISLDATGSSDPDGTIVSYQWLENGVVIATGEVTSVDLAVGSHTITLRVTDSDGLTDEDTLVVEVESPIAGMAVAGADQMVRDSDNNGSETISLDASGSLDPDGTIVSYQWLENGTVIATGEITSVDLSVGTHTIILRVTGNDGVFDEDTLVVVIERTPEDDPLTTIQLVSGPDTGVPGSSIGPFTVRLTGDGQLLPNVEVRWSVVPANAGNVAASITSTDANGEATNSLNIVTSRTLKLRVTADDADPVDFTINGLEITPGLDENQASGAAALDNACPALADAQGQGNALSFEEQDLLTTCESLNAADAQVRSAGLNQLVPEQVAAQGTAMIEAATTQVTNIDARLNSLRGGAIGVRLGGLSLNVKGYNLPSVLWDSSARNAAEGGAASTDSEPSGRLGFFVNGAITLGERDSTNRETGFDFDTTGITAGVDYRLTDQLIYGGALGYAVTDSQFIDSSGAMDIEAVSLSIYGTYYQSSRSYVDGIVSFGSHNYNHNRRLSTTSEQSGEGDTKGVEFTLSIGAGYDFVRESLTFGPYGRLSFAQANIDGYLERASDPGAVGAGSVLEIGDQQIDSLTSVAGGLASYVISTPKGVFIPQVRVEWEHEFSDDSRLITAQFVHDPTATKFTIITEEPDRNYLNLGVGMSAIFKGGKAAFLHYETQLANENISQYSLKGGIRIEF